MADVSLSRPGVVRTGIAVPGLQDSQWGVVPSRSQDRGILQSRPQGDLPRTGPVLTEVATTAGPWDGLRGRPCQCCPLLHVGSLPKQPCSDQGGFGLDQYTKAICQARRPQTGGFVQG